MLIGTWQTIPHPMVTEILTNEMDFCILDMEHSSFSLQDIRNCINAKANTDALVMVRAPSLDPVMIQRIDEQKPDAILVPGISTPQMFIDALYSTSIHYTKGVSPYTPLNAYGMTSPQHTPSTPVYPMIEHIDMIDGGVLLASEIAKIMGFSFEAQVVYVGIYDLSRSMNIPGQLDNLELLNKMESFAKELKGFHIRPACLVKSAEGVALFEGMGYEILAWEADCKMLYDSTSRIMDWIQ